MDEFIKLQVDRLGITVLTILDEKYHEEGHNGCTREGLINSQFHAKLCS